MKLKTVLSSILLLALASCGGEHHDHHDHDHDHEGHDHESEMHEGKEEHNHEGAITLDEHQAEAFGVKCQTLSPGDFSEVMKVSGAVEPASTDMITVSATRSGIFTLSKGITVGSRLGAGSAVGSISSKGIQGGDANAVAAATLAAARREVERLKPLLKEGLVTEAAFNEAQKAYEEAKAASGGVQAGSGAVVAPAAGTLSELFVSSGQYVEVGTPVAMIVRSSRLTLRADVPERYAASIPAIVSANFRPDCSEKVFRLSELDGRPLAPGSINPVRNGYVPVYFSFNGNGDVLPGSFAEIFLVSSPRQNVISIPREALIEMQGNYYAYVRVHGHKDAYEKRLVQTGASDGLRVEVLGGIKPGEDVVVQGASVVRMAETSAIAPPGHSHNH